jgi:orotidine-5'-phosphate decarboxylase
VDTIDEARNFADALYPKINIFKVGSHLFTAYGPAVVEMLRQKGAEVFLDLKYFDIPNTVAKAVSAAVRLNIKMFTLHIAGGREMIEAAVESAKKEADARSIVRAMLIGVTVLTSSNAASGDVLEMVQRESIGGWTGVVCSAKEAEFLRGKIKKDFVIVTPASGRMATPGTIKKGWRPFPKQ